MKELLSHSDLNPTAEALPRESSLDDVSSNQFSSSDFLVALQEGDEKKTYELLSLLKSGEEFEQFIDLLSATPLRHNLSQGVVDRIVEESLRFLEEEGEKDGTIDFSKVCKVAHAFMLNGDFTRNNPADESINDKSFRSLINLYEKYPRAGRELENIFGQNHTVRPDIFIDETAQAVGKYGGDQYLKQDLLRSMQYLYAFGGDSYNEAIKRNLNFRNPDQYHRTANFLEFIKKLYAVSENEAFSEEKAPEFAVILKEVIDKAEGSYLLNARAQEIFETMVFGEWKNDHDTVPVRISHNKYIFHNNEILLISREAEVGEIEECINQIISLRSEIDLSLDKWGQINGNHPLLRRAKELHEHLLGYFVDATPETIGVQSAKEDDVADYAYLLNKTTRERVERDFKIKISDLSIPEQFQFLNFLKTKEAKEIPAVKSFAEKYGASGFRTFLSLEYGRELGDDIIMLGEKLSPEDARAIFQKYNEVAEAAANVAEEVRPILKKNRTFSPEEIEKIQDHLMKKGREMLVNFSVVVKESAGRVDVEGLKKRLESIKTDILVFASIFKSFSQSETEGVSLNDVEGIEISTYTDITHLGREQQEMARIFEENRRNYDPRLFKETKEEFEGAMRVNKSEFHILKYGGEIVAFMRFDDLPNGNFYAGSLNVRPEIRGATIGSAFLKELLGNKSAKEGKEIEALVYSKNPMLKHYLDDFGFKITEDLPNYKGTGELFHKIVIPKKAIA